MRPLDLINVRQYSHGDFRDNGRIMQALKRVMRAKGPNWDTLFDYQREALEMIQHKIGRILSGDPGFYDHWDDIAGYAVRVATILREDAMASPQQKCDPAVLGEVNRALGEGGSFMAPAGASPLK